MTSTNDKCISIETKKRLAKDVRDIYKNPLHSENIYYHHDMDNILSGYAMIIGDKDTVYKYGMYLFKFEYPIDYPYHPPKVVFLTNDGITRFHPNLYRTGKVCLSILNTWAGEQWSSCQTIRSVLLTLMNIFDDKPILHEPYIQNYKTDIIENYNKCIIYKNYDFVIYKLCMEIFVNNDLNKNKSNTTSNTTSNNNTIYKIYRYFEEDIKNNMKKNIDNIIEDILKQKTINTESTIYINFAYYQKMSIMISYKKLYEKMIHLKECLIKSNII